MPANTTNLGLPYPVGADPINVATDVQRLAEAIDLQALRRGVGAQQTGQAYAAGAWLPMTFNAAVYDDDGFFTPGGSVFTVPPDLPGLYTVSATVNASAPMSAASAVYLTTGGAGFSGEYWSYIPTGQTHGTVVATGLLVPGSTVELTVINGHNAAVTFTASIQINRAAPDYI